MREFRKRGDILRSHHKRAHEFQPRYPLEVNVDYRPLEYWAKQWVKDGVPMPVTTIRTWILQAKCPTKKIGDRWMISNYDLLNWPGAD